MQTDVGGVKTDLSKTQSDLATTISQLQSVRGDLSSTNSVIARNHDELVTLAHRGDRNYYEFTLTKGQRKPVGTVSLELKKTDPKQSRFTLDIYADDKAYEKKNRNVNEPLQFYSGKDPALFEVVVNTINSKNQISGYLSAPKGAPVPRYCSIMATWGVTVERGLVPEIEGKVQLLAGVPLLLGHLER